jgi:predicted nucleic acid-binding protein
LRHDRRSREWLLKARILTRQDSDRMLTPPWTSVSGMAEGLVDTSVVIDWDDPAVIGALPEDIAISTITLAELAAGPHLAKDVPERARRQARLQQVESLFDPLDFDAAAARSFGQIVAAVVAVGRSHRSRTADLQIAAVAHANKLALYTRNPQDFKGLDAVLDIVGV